MSRNRLAIRLFKSVGYITLSALFLLLMQSQRVFGQVDEGSITGTVQDPTGAVVPNAQVTLLNTDQGITLTTTTNGAGEYTFSPVRIGHYSITVTAPGFSTTTQQNLQVTVGLALQVNVQLKTGAASQTVEVTTAPPSCRPQSRRSGKRSPVKPLIICPSTGATLPSWRSWARARIHRKQTPEAMRHSGAFTANGLQARAKQLPARRH